MLVRVKFILIRLGSELPWSLIMIVQLVQMRESSSNWRGNTGWYCSSRFHVWTQIVYLSSSKAWVDFLTFSIGVSGDAALARTPAARQSSSGSAVSAYQQCKLVDWVGRAGGLLKTGSVQSSSHEPDLKRDIPPPNRAYWLSPQRTPPPKRCGLFYNYLTQFFRLERIVSSRIGAGVPFFLCVHSWELARLAPLSPPPKREAVPFSGIFFNIYLPVLSSAIIPLSEALVDEERKRWERSQLPGWIVLICCVG